MYTITSRKNITSRISANPFVYGFAFISCILIITVGALLYLRYQYRQAESTSDRISTFTRTLATSILVDAASNNTAALAKAVVKIGSQWSAYRDRVDVFVDESTGLTNTLAISFSKTRDFLDGKERAKDEATSQFSKLVFSNEDVKRTTLEIISTFIEEVNINEKRFLTIFSRRA